MRRRKGFDKVAILGTGLIGSSIGLALQKNGAARRVIAWDKVAGNARLARHRHAVDEVAPNLFGAIAGAEVIILAIPMEAVPSVLRQVARGASPGALVIDTAPLKLSVLKLATRELSARKDLHFIGGHPLAGSDKRGPAHADAALLKERTFFLCNPYGRQASVSLKKARKLVRLLGAFPAELSAVKHDRLIAMVSALPQLIASSLALAVGGTKRGRFVGPGYLDTTRLALSPPHLWSSNLVVNSKNVDNALARFELALRQFRSHLAKGDVPQLDRLLQKAAAARRRSTP